MSLFPISVTQLRCNVFGLTTLVACSACGATDPEPDTPALGQQRHAIVGGNASPSEQDAVVRITDSAENAATGVLVGSRLVLTARHFLFEMDDSESVNCDSALVGFPLLRAYDPADFRVFVGKGPDLRETARGTRIHASSVLDLCTSDIALLELDTPLEVPAMPLRLSGGPLESEPGRIIGWGVTEQDPDDYPSERRQRDAEILAIGPDLFPRPEHEPLTVLETMFITGESGCYGDAGAPFISADTGAVVGVLSTIEPADPALLFEPATINDCINGYPVFRSLASEHDRWLVDAFTEAGDSPWHEGLAPPADLGSACSENRECRSGMCIESESAKFCSITCERDDCGEGLTCIGEPGERFCAPERVLGATGTTNNGCTYGPSSSSAGSGAVLVLLLGAAVVGWRRCRREGQPAPRTSLTVNNKYPSR